MDKIDTPYFSLARKVLFFFEVAPSSGVFSQIVLTQDQYNSLLAFMAENIFTNKEGDFFDIITNEKVTIKIDDPKANI